MEFVKSEIHNYTWKVKNVMQFTMDDVVNVPDSHLDIEKLVLVKGNVVIDESQAMVDRFQVKGTLNYQILYCADKEGKVFDHLEGKIPFVEYINADGTKETDYIEVHACLNDLTVTMLHSRKISLKALIGLDYQVKEDENFSAVTDIEDMAGAKMLKGSYSMMSLKLHRKAGMLVEEKMEIPSNKPDIYQVVWKSMTATGVQVKPADGYLLASGNLIVFLVYTAEEEEMPLQYFTLEVPFEKKIDENEALEDMISGSVVSLDGYHIAVSPDENGADRILEVAADFTAEIKLYGKEEFELLRDAYSTEVEMNPKWKSFTMQHLLLRNCAKTKVADTVMMSNEQTLLQICNVEGSVSIDETTRTAGGIMVEGAVSTQVTYLGGEGSGALASTTFDIPFSYEIEVPGMKELVTYSIVPSIDQITAALLNESQIEIKAEVSLEVLAFTNEQAKAVLDVEVTPINMERKKEMPGIIGYIVKKDDTLWGIAKSYYTTVDRIKEMNDKDSDLVAEGERLLIMKE